MIDLDGVLESLKWIPDELADGMAFFEGVVPRIGRPVDVQTLAQVTPLSSEKFEFSTWDNDTPDELCRANHEAEALVEFFRDGTLCTLILDYVRDVDDTQLDMRLMFHPEAGETLLEMLCRRGPILDCADPMLAIGRGIEEFARIHELFAGNALFVGPGCCDIPRSPEASLAEWLRVL
jgi:hypothetical protein